MLRVRGVYSQLCSIPKALMIICPVYLICVVVGWLTLCFGGLFAHNLSLKAAVSGCAVSTDLKVLANLLFALRC
jgi:hypothetical protein